MRNSLLHSQKIHDPNDSALLSEQEHCMPNQSPVSSLVNAAIL